jgi:hypothetical protein
VATYKKRDYTPRLRGRKLEEYGRIMFLERQKLIVSDERRAWILARYPPDEIGSPIIPNLTKKDG